MNPISELAKLGILRKIYFLPRWKERFAMALAPLRRIIGRSIEVFKFHNDRPAQFMIVDALECGHSYFDLEWSFLDLVNPYSEVAGKKRHRCHECAAAIARNETRKPMATVTTVSTWRVA